MGSSRRDSVRKDIYFIAGLVVIAAGLLLYLVANPYGPDQTATAALSPPPPTPAATPGGVDGGTQPAPIERRETGDPFALGQTTAPVTMVMFSDYRCPFCAKFSRDIEPELVERFVNSGDLRIEWRDYPIFGEQSRLAARAGRAAAEQGRFWEFNRAVYAAAPERAKADFTEDNLIEFARQAGVADIERFTSEMRSTDFDAAIDADLAQGNRIGVPSTPAFLINDTPVLGAQPTEEFVRVITESRDRR
ncbi:DsbA family protein [Mycolicibacterium sp.]|uniref:DsbA family protein n=1 Tax=Mycolicibacterium sp. TaxID=2320850 RepID=UPI00355F0D55